MIWATVSSCSCFCWLYRASPSLAVKNIINLISVLTIWWCPCVESSLCCWKRVFAMTSVFFWQNSVSLCPASFHTPRPNLPVTPGVSWLPILHSSPLQWRGHLLGVLVLEGLVGIHRTIQLQLLQHYWSGHNWDYHDIEWFAMEMNRDHSVIFGTAYKYCTAVNVLHSTHKQIWKTQHWPQDWKRSVFIPIPKKGNLKNPEITAQLHSSHILVK